MRVFRAVFHEQSRRVDALVNQVMHQAGQTWAAPPGNEEPVGILERQLELADVDQEPDY